MHTLDLENDIFEPYRQQIQDLLESKDIALKKFSTEDQRLLFDAASGFYQSGQYDSAILIFRGLVLSAPLNPTYWQSLSSTLQMNKKYDEALIGWAILANFERDNPLFALRCAECLLLQGKLEEGKESLQKAYSLTSQENDVKDEITRLMQAWELPL